MDKRTIISLGLLGIILLITHFGYAYRVPGLWIVITYVLIYFVLGRFIKSKPDIQLTKSWPTSGPIGRFGQTGLATVFYSSGLLGLLNPFQMAQIILQGVGNILLRFREYPLADISNSHKVVQCRVPVSGTWLVYNGGITPDSSHSWGVLTQRYAYDLVKADEGYRRHSGTGTKVTDYYCYGEPVYAVATGEVVKVVSNIRTSPLVGFGLADFLATNLIGNHLIIKHGEREFSFYAHLMPGSIGVSIGEQVSAGQVIGRCGHSGHSSEPHLHFHMQDRKNFFFAMGLPVRFTNITVTRISPDQTFLQAGDRFSSTLSN